jgi:hypothetical protein
MTELSRKETFLRAIFDVVVPRGSALAGVARGSGMVASYSRDGWVVVDFEGDVATARDPGRTYADRVHSAAGRHITAYPTIARREVPVDQVLRVGRD